MQGRSTTPTAIRIAVSAAASWAWGTSLVVGRSTIMTKGFPVFLIWAVCNCIALPLFSLIFHRLKLMHKIVNTKALVLFMTIIQIFSVWIQMNAIYEIAMQTGLFTEGAAQALSYATAALFVIAMYRNGLLRSIKTDQVQWAGVILGTVVIILIGSFGGHFRSDATMVPVTAANVHWAIKTGLILFCGPIMDIQHWQRLELADKRGVRWSYALAGVLFSVYMALVAMTSMFDFSPIMHIVLLAAVFCVATSTLDSAAVALHKIGGSGIGLILGTGAVLTWQFVIRFGVLDLWTYMGTIRMFVCGACLLAAIALTINSKVNRHE